MHKSKEKFLLARIRLFQDHKALEALIGEFGGRIQKFLHAKLPSREDADDAFSETWARFWTYAQSTAIDSASGLLHTIARGMVADFYRKRENQPSTAVEPETMEDLVEDPLSDALIDRIDAGLLKKEMEAMDEDEAFVLTLRFQEGYRVKDIAKFLDRTENATSVLLNRITNKLRKRLKEKFTDTYE